MWYMFIFFTALMEDRNAEPGKYVMHSLRCLDGRELWKEIKKNIQILKLKYNEFFLANLMGSD